MPRRKGTPASNDGPDEPVSHASIVATATRLFAEKGYTQTTMSDIAREVGLHQSSLYYWFRRKELILQAVFDSSRVPVDFVESILDGPGTSALKLYRFVRFDTFRICNTPCDANEIDRLAEGSPTEFKTYWVDRQRLHTLVSELVRSGTAAGEFVEVDPDLASLNIVSSNEGVQKRVRYQRNHRAGRRHPFTYPSYDAELVAETHASTTVRGYLKRSTGLAAIARQAARYDDIEVARNA